MSLMILAASSFAAFEKIWIADVRDLRASWSVWRRMGGSSQVVIFYNRTPMAVPSSMDCPPPWPWSNDHVSYSRKPENELLTWKHMMSRISNQHDLSFEPWLNWWPIQKLPEVEIPHHTANVCYKVICQIIRRFKNAFKAMSLTCTCCLHLRVEAFICAH